MSAAIEVRDGILLLLDAIPISHQVEVGEEDTFVYDMAPEQYLADIDYHRHSEMLHAEYA